MSSYVTNVNTKLGGGTTYVDIGTLFCDNSYNQTLGGVKTFSGIVYVPTASSDASNTQVINAAWMYAKNYAPIDSPTFTGTPWAPTPATDASLTQLVTAKWVNDKNYASVSQVYALGFNGSVITTTMTYPANGGDNNITVKYSDGSSIYFGYGIYMCCMRSSSGKRNAMNVEFVRITTDGPDDEAGGLDGPFNNGGITQLHFRPYQSAGTHYITITGSTGSDEILSLRFYSIN